MARATRIWPFHADIDFELWDHRFSIGDFDFSDSKDTKEKDIENAEIVVEKNKGDDVVGTTDLYVDGRLRLIPTPSPDPRDPVNLPDWRKWTAVSMLCFFGALCMATEFAIAGLLPVFMLEYSGIDPATILSDATTNLHIDLLDPGSVVPDGVLDPVPLADVALLAAVPLLANGLATLVLVPLSTAVGRRPVLVFTATCAWAGGFWASASGSLGEHVAARVMHGLGAGAVEALIPLVIQDIIFAHERNTALAAVVASQGPVLVVIGTLAPYVAVNFTWRLVYHFTSALVVLAWLGLLIFVPETRKIRSPAELAGQDVWPVPPGADRTPIDPETYGRRTLRYEIGFFTLGFEWRHGAEEIVRVVRCTWLPGVLFATAISTVCSIVLQAAGQLLSFGLLAADIPFQYTGLSVAPSLLASLIVFLLGGRLADTLSLYTTRRLGRGRRKPEYQLPNLALPLVISIVGCIVFGMAAQRGLHVAVLLLGAFLVVTGLTTAAAPVNTFLIESYPQWAAPVLGSVASVRVFVAFFFSARVSAWAGEIGPLRLFVVFAAVLLGLLLVGVVFFFHGKTIRRWTGQMLR